MPGETPNLIFTATKNLQFRIYTAKNKKLNELMLDEANFDNIEDLIIYIFLLFSFF